MIWTDACAKPGHRVHRLMDLTTGTALIARRGSFLVFISAAGVPGWGARDAWNRTTLMHASTARILCAQVAARTVLISTCSSATCARKIFALIA